jgi:hypothetical protein
MERMERTVLAVDVSMRMLMNIQCENMNRAMHMAHLLTGVQKYSFLGCQPQNTVIAATHGEPNGHVLASGCLNVAIDRIKASSQSTLPLILETASTWHAENRSTRFSNVMALHACMLHGCIAV